MTGSKMPSVPPLRALTLLFYVACIALVIMVFSPGEVRIAQDTTFSVFSLQDLGQEQGEAAPATDLAFLAQTQANVKAQEKLLDKGEFLENKLKNPDSLASSNLDDSLNALIPEKTEPVEALRQPLEFAEENPNALDPFFKAIHELRTQPKLVRVLHFGDSQIEGDRVTEYLRHRLQGRFGGSGIGLIPVHTRGNIRTTMITKYSDNWKKYAYRDSPSNPKHNLVGIMGEYDRFTPVGAPKGENPRKAWVKFKDTGIGYVKNSQVESVKILGRSIDAPLALSFRLRTKDQKGKTDSLWHETTVAASSDLFLYQAPIQAKFEELTVEFSSVGNPEILGVALDGQAGIAVDNIPWRGSAGDEITRMNADFWRKQLAALDVKLIIVEFGVNIGGGWGAQAYEDFFYKQYQFLKSLSPEVGVIVVSTSDRAQRKGTGYASIPSVKTIKEAQRRAALRAGCVFWDLHAAMGGENSMVSWVRNKPALAQSDYTHFTTKGVRLVAEMLYSALINEYENYRLKVQ
ncbi:hypothetical protein [Hugenholtzia roseola]|uniref:hypothetical protein n=1 Tax=Hugenholtzia roseola TaxID=1002 RepID=UPI00047E36D3|nr:hypothetical protein [Hugenholtzia roseola]